MDLSIIIVNWNSAEYLADCLTGIFQMPMRVSMEIVVIDNASFDGCDRLLSSRFPGVQFIQSQENLGFARANNLAFAASTGQVVCFINPDTRVRKDALQKMYDVLAQDRQIGIVGARLLNSDGSVQTSCTLPFPTILNQTLDSEWLRKHFPQSPLYGTAALLGGTGGSNQVEAISGACMMMRRDIFTAVGKFSTEYFMYAEDVDLCRKVTLAGHPVYLVKDAEIVHYGGGSSMSQKNRLFGALLMRESNYIYLKKFRGPVYALLYRAAMAGAGIVRLVCMGLAFIPMTGAGHARELLDMMERWWRLVRWAAGGEQWTAALRHEGGGP